MGSRKSCWGRRKKGKGLERQDGGVEFFEIPNRAFRNIQRLRDTLGKFCRGIIFPVQDPVFLLQPLNQPSLHHPSPPFPSFGLPGTVSVQRDGANALDRCTSRWGASRFGTNRPWDYEAVLVLLLCRVMSKA